MSKNMCMTWKSGICKIFLLYLFYNMREHHVCCIVLVWKRTEARETNEATFAHPHLMVFSWPFLRSVDPTASANQKETVRPQTYLRKAFEIISFEKFLIKNMGLDAEFLHHFLVFTPNLMYFQSDTKNKLKAFRTHMVDQQRVCAWSHSFPLCPGWGADCNQASGWELGRRHAGRQDWHLPHSLRGGKRSTHKHAHTHTHTHTHTERWTFTHQVITERAVKSDAAAETPVSQCFHLS